MSKKKQDPTPKDGAKDGANDDAPQYRPTVSDLLARNRKDAIAHAKEIAARPPVEILATTQGVASPVEQFGAAVLDWLAQDQIKALICEGVNDAVDLPLLSDDMEAALFEWAYATILSGVAAKFGD